MALTIGEASAVTQLLRYTLDTDGPSGHVSPEGALEAALLLAGKAYKTLGAGLRPEQVSELWPGPGGGPGELRRELEEARARLDAAGQAPVYLDDDGRKFVYVEDVAQALWPSGELDPGPGQDETAEQASTDQPADVAARLEQVLNAAVAELGAALARHRRPGLHITEEQMVDAALDFQRDAAEQHKSAEEAGR